MQLCHHQIMFAVLPPFDITSPACRVPACRGPIYRGPLHRQSPTYKRCINTALTPEPNPPALVRTVGTSDLIQIQLFKQPRHYGSCNFDSYEIKYALDNFGQLTLLVQSKLDDFSKLFTFEKSDRVDPTRISFENVSRGLLINLPRSSRRVIISQAPDESHSIPVFIRQRNYGTEIQNASEADDHEIDFGSYDDEAAQDFNDQAVSGESAYTQVQVKEAEDEDVRASPSIKKISVTVEDPETEILVKESSSDLENQPPASSPKKKLRSPSLEVVEDNGL